MWQRKHYKSTLTLELGTSVLLCFGKSSAEPEAIITPGFSSPVNQRNLISIPYDLD